MAAREFKSIPFMDSVHVSLQDVLEVRGKPLDEWELWGVMYETVQAVLDIFLKGIAALNGVPQYLVSADNLLCSSTGHVTLTVCTPDIMKTRNCFDTELFNKTLPSVDCFLEKMYVNSIAQTILYAANYSQDAKNQKKLSPLMKTVLQAMCQNDDDLQMVLSDVSEICKSHALKYLKGHSFAKAVCSLYEEVLGGAEDENLYHFHTEDNNHSGRNPLEECMSDNNDNTKATSEDRGLVLCSEDNSDSVSVICDEKDVECVHEEKSSLSAIKMYYEELKKKQKKLELLKINSEIPDYPVYGDVNSSLLEGLKPKTSVKLMMLTEHSANFAAIHSKSCSEVPNCALENSNGAKIDDNTFVWQPNFVYEKPYYALDKVLPNTFINWSEISFPGPEFVTGKLKPHYRLTVTIPENGKFLQSGYIAIISLLNGEHIDVQCLPSTTGRQLYQLIADHLKLQERYLFGLAYEEGGEHVFLERKQQLSETLRSAATSTSVVSPNVIKLSLRVKFFVEDTHLLRTQTLRHMFYLQLRKDFLDDDFYCETRLALFLGGLALQAEFGEYNSTLFGKEYFLLEHYLPYVCIKHMKRSEAKEKLMKSHAVLQHMPKDIAELKFIQGMMKTPEYGCHFHRVLLDKQNLSSMIWLGIKSVGINVYDSCSRRRSICHSYPWENIKRISFSKKYFCIVPKIENNLGKHVIYRFYTSVTQRSQYLFNISMSHHKFYLKLKSVPKVSEIFIDDVDEEHPHFCEKPLVNIEKDLDCFDNNHESPTQDIREKKMLKNMGQSSSIYDVSEQRKTKLFFQGGTIKLKGSERIKRRKTSIKLLARSNSTPNPTFKNDFCCAKKEILSRDLGSKAPHATKKFSPGKHVNMRAVKLNKDPVCGLGMVISCGNTYETLLHGAFVECVHPGGPAEQAGNICAGDQILSVNGIDVQNDYYLDVVDLIKCSNSAVELVFGRPDTMTALSPYSQKEVIEPSFTKSKMWICTDESLKTKFSEDKLSNSTSFPDTPIPKPRKKYIEREKKQEQLNLDTPDITINHTNNSPGKKCKESDLNMINSHFTIENCNIPDIIASQMKHLPSQHSNKCEISNEKTAFVAEQIGSENYLLPGEVYHVVLDKKGGSLGLNIYQGIDSSCSEEKHIYIHSVIPNGAAELDGRIKPGDKLLEVNGVMLDNLSYQEVVTKLRESPQVAHLVLEKGDLFEVRTENENFQNIADKTLECSDVPGKVNDEKCNSTETFHFERKPSLTTAENNVKNMANENIADSFLTNYELEEKTFSSLPTSVQSSPSFHAAKDTSSAPSSFQQSNVESNHRISQFDKHCGSDDFAVSPHGKIQNKNVYESRIQNSMSLYKSTPNLAENSDEEEKMNTSGSLYRNRSTDCLLYSPHFMNPHQALFELYRNYACNRGSSSNIHQIPAVPIRKKKLKKLEDICNYSNSDNTFLVKIRKSSRGLGLGISGGRDASRKDPFSQLIQIRKLYPLQPALECGKLALGDVLLEANGISMIGLTNTEALEVLRSAPSEVVLKVFRPSKSLIPSFSLFKGGFWPFFESSSSSASSSLSRTENNSTYNVETREFEITLIKRGGSLGFTISRKEKTAETAPEGIYVKALVREPAVSDGRIQPGDRILQVNGTSVSSMSHAEAIEFIRNTPDTVTLKLFREDPPLTPGNFEDDYTITKPLRWEAVELLNDRVKHKEINNTENGVLNRKIKRKINRPSNAPSSSSTESTSSSSSGGREHLIDDIMDESMELCGMTEELYIEGGGLQRNQRPKSLDVLNSSERKRLTGFGNEDSFHRQSSVMCSTAEVKSSENSENNSSPAKKGKNLLKWRGSTMPDSEESSSPEILYEVSTDSLDNASSEVLTSSIMTCDDEDDSDDRPIPFPRSTSYANEWVHTFDVDLDRGWHGRLGFSLCDSKEVPPESPRNKLPIACEVKAVYPASIADKDGRIKVGDRLVEVNRECMLRKPANEVIDILRKTRGVIRMVFCRLIQRS